MKKLYCYVPLLICLLAQPAFAMDEDSMALLRTPAGRLQWQQLRYDCTETSGKQEAKDRAAYLLVAAAIEAKNPQYAYNTYGERANTAPKRYGQTMRLAYFYDSFGALFAKNGLNDEALRCKRSADGVMNQLLNVRAEELNAITYREKAMAALVQKRPREAGASLKTALKHAQAAGEQSSQLPLVLTELAFVQFQLKQPKDALANYEKALALFDKQPEGYEEGVQYTTSASGDTYKPTAWLKGDVTRELYQQTLAGQKPAAEQRKPKIGEHFVGKLPSADRFAVNRFDMIQAEKWLVERREVRYAGANSAQHIGWDSQ